MSPRTKSLQIGDDRGATIVEFALVLVPLCLVLLGGLDLGYQSYVRSVLQGALNDVARKASVEDPQFSSTADTLERRVKDALVTKMGGLAGTDDLQVDAKSYSDFSGVGKPERLITDLNKNGAYDLGDCWQDSNPNGAFDADAGSSGFGGASDVVFYDASIDLPRVVPIWRLLGVSDRIKVTAKAAIRNQPYADQAEPKVKC